MYAHCASRIMNLGRALEEGLRFQLRQCLSQRSVASCWELITSKIIWDHATPQTNCAANGKMFGLASLRVPVPADTDAHGRRCKRHVHFFFVLATRIFVTESADSNSQAIAIFTWSIATFGMVHSTATSIKSARSMTSSLSFSTRFAFRCRC